GYTGHETDAATGLVYAQQRYYDPVLGRFLSADPVAANGGNGANFNRFRYANDNPYRYTDPSGKATSCSTGTHLSGQSCESLGVSVTQVGTRSASETKAAAAATAIAIRVGAGATSNAAGAATATAAGTLLEGVAVGALVYPTATASDDTLSAQAAKELDQPISSSNPREGQYVYRISGGLSPTMGASWTPINPALLRLAGYNVRDLAGLPNTNLGTQMTVSRIVNPAGITAIRPALPYGTHGGGIPNQGGLPEYLIPNPAATLQPINTFKVDPAF
ncbi:RHS repeat-associated core domain-containing protein, partial [Mizugakiibacter sediminis]